MPISFPKWMYPIRRDTGVLSNIFPFNDPPTQINILSLSLPLLRFLGLALLCFASCKAPKEKPPIPFQDMKALMLDIHLAETYSQGLGDTTGNKFDKNYDSLPVFYASVLKHHNLTFEEFNEALQWYRDRPMQMDSLYAGILDQLNTLKAKEGIKDIDDSSPQPAAGPAKPDSLKSGDKLAKDSLAAKTTKKETDTTGKNKHKQRTKPPTTQAEP